MKFQLRDYQLIGVNWMNSLYESRLGCVLADDSGLGKTVQTIGFLTHIVTSHSVWGPHLILVPTCHLLSWESLLERCAPAIRTLIYCGDTNMKRKLRKVSVKYQMFFMELFVQSFIQIVVYRPFSMVRTGWTFSPQISSSNSFSEPSVQENKCLVFLRL